MFINGNDVAGFQTRDGINNRILYYEAMADGPDMISYKDISEELAYEYRGDFYGLLLHLGIPARQQFLCMYLNGLSNPLDFEGVAITLKIPNDPRVFG